MLESNIISACPDGILAVDREGRITGLNDAARKMFGWTGDTLVGRSLSELVPHGSRDKHSRLMREFFAGAIDTVPMRDWRGIQAQRRDGVRFPVMIRLVVDDAFEDRLTIAFIRDMSEMAELEKALACDEAALKHEREKNALLALVAEHTTDSVIITDAEGLTIWVNQATEVLSGYGMKDFLGRKPGDLLQGPDTDQDVSCEIGAAIREGRSIRCELLNYNRNGEGYWIEMNMTPIRGPDGRVDKFIAVERDITQKKQQEQALDEARRKAERAEGRLASAIEAISEGFVIYDEYDRLVLCNSAYKKMRAEDADIIVPGVTFEELVRTAVERGHFDTEGMDPDSWVRKQVEARRAGHSVETMVHFTDGRWMLRRERRTPQGEMIGIRSDITAFKQQEAALEDARRRAEAADRAKSEFVANISHELRTPINGIIGFNQLMLSCDLGDKQRERAEIIKASSEHLLQLVNDLLDLSRIASNSVQLEPMPFDVGELAQEAVELMTPLASDNHLALEGEIKVPMGALINGDRSRIKQILLNLIGNAIKFTEQGGVTLKVAESDGGVAFTVADTGPGMPADKLQTIFDRFAQLKNQRAGAQGAGLGLAITKGLVDLMGGDIDVHSELGAGSVFTVRLPLRVLPPDRDANGSNGEKKEDAAEERRLPMYDVLVAEDHPFNQVLIVEILESIGCRVTMAENGQEALDQLENNAFDLIIMDNQMPVMSGLEAIRHIRARTDWKTRIPILALTANAMRGAEKEYEAHGVEQFMTKPLDVNRVIEAVKRLASAGRKIRDEAFSTVS